jgi:hypothetical protein
VTLDPVAGVVPVQVFDAWHPHCWSERQEVVMRVWIPLTLALCFAVPCAAKERGVDAAKLIAKKARQHGAFSEARGSDGSIARDLKMRVDVVSPTRTGVAVDPKQSNQPGTTGRIFDGDGERLTRRRTNVSYKNGRSMVVTPSGALERGGLDPQTGARTAETIQRRGKDGRFGKSTPAPAGTN